MQRRWRNRLHLAPVGQLPYARPAEDRQLYQHRTARCTAAALQTADAGLPKPSGSSGRRTILEQELANEQQALASAQNELSAARAQKNQNRASQLTANIQDRRQNIQALQRELSRM